MPECPLLHTIEKLHFPIQKKCGIMTVVKET